MIRLVSNNKPLSFDQWISLMNLRFKLFGRADTQKKFDKYKHAYYNEDTDNQIDSSYIETPKNLSEE